MASSRAVPKAVLRWIRAKYEITARLRRRLSDGFGRTRPSYKGAFIFMSAKTDPFLPIPDLLHITRNNLEVSLQADVFLMCQTRSGEVVENPEIFSLIAEMARYKKIGVSFSVSTDILEEQRMIEHGGLAPEHRLRTMARLKEAGVFVSAAVSPLMPYSVEFPQRLLDCAHHASIQLLRPSGFGSSTPKGLLNNVERVVPRYRELDRKLIEEINMLKQSNVFAWGVGNKGFIGAFLAAKQFYENR